MRSPVRRLAGLVPAPHVVDRLVPRVEVQHAGHELLGRVDAPVVFAANHASDLDAGFVAQAAPHHLRVSQQPPTVALRRGHSVVMFPEGGPSPDATLRAFGDAASRVAAEHGRPVVPVAIRGSFGLDAEPSRWRVAGTPVVLVRFGVPLEAPGPDELRDAVAALLAEDDATWWQSLAPATGDVPAAGWLSAWRQLDPARQSGDSRRPRIWG